MTSTACASRWAHRLQLLDWRCCCCSSPCHDAAAAALRLPLLLPPLPLWPCLHPRMMIHAALLRSQGVSMSETVGQHMSTPPIVARPTMRTGEAAAIMLAKKIHRLPVVDEEGRFIG